MNDFINSTLSPTTLKIDASGFKTIEPSKFARLTLHEAVPIWSKIREQRERLKPRTHETTSDYFVALEKFFDTVRLKDITAGQLREYQIARSANLLHTDQGDMHPWKKPAGHSIINHEISALGKLLNHCGRWRRLKPDYAPLSIPAWSPRDVPNEDEEERLWEAAAGHPEAELAYCVACITNNTSAAGCELRGLRIRHLAFNEPDLDEDGKDRNPSFVYIPAEAVKNENRPRRIPLNPLALSAFKQIYKRALKCGSCQPDDYLFPFRVSPNEWDPKRPASRWFLRKSWEQLIRITNLPDLKPHDLRHLMITRGLENGADPDKLRAVCGHINPKLTDYYSHMRMRGKYDVVMQIMPGAKTSQNSKEPEPKKAKTRSAGSSASQDKILSAIAAMMERQTAALEKLAATK